MIRIGEILLEPQPTPFWQILRQVGVEDAVGVLPVHLMEPSDIRADRPWDYAPLAVYQEAIGAEGLRLSVVEDNPPMDRIRLGRPGREEEIEEFCVFLRALGRLGVPVLCYNWMTVLSWQRTSTATRGRGGALVTAYDHGRVGDEPTRIGTVDEEDLWANLKYFLERVLPVAEEAGVRMGMHPDDPPRSPMRGIGRIIRTPEAFERLVELVPSEMSGVTLCQGNVALMTDDVPKVIRDVGGAGKLFFVHFRDVRGTADRFVETFADEGQTDMLECMRAYRDVGFDGVLRSDHVPAVAGDAAEVPGYSSLARLFTIGYAAALREAVYADSPVTSGAA